MNTELLEQLENGTANLHYFKKEDFQYNYDNIVSSRATISLFGSESIEEESVDDSDDENKISLIVIDGEAGSLRRGSPPNLQPLPEEASILNIG